MSFDERYEIPDILQRVDFRRGEFDLEISFDRNDESDVRKAVPLGHVFGAKLGRKRDVDVHDVQKYVLQPLRDGVVFHLICHALNVKKSHGLILMFDLRCAGGSKSLPDIVPAQETRTYYGIKMRKMVDG